MSSHTEAFSGTATRCEPVPVCEQCGSHKDVSFEPDPFDWSVYGDSAPHNLCAECIGYLSEDI